MNNYDILVTLINGKPAEYKIRALSESQAFEIITNTKVMHDLGIEIDCVQKITLVGKED